MHVNIPRAVAPDYDVIPESTVTAAPRSKHSKDVSRSVRAMFIFVWMQATDHNYNSYQASSRKRLTNTMRSLKGTGQRR